MTKTLSVSAIQHGTVIDHIPPGQAMRIITMLHLLENKSWPVTVGFNLTSQSMRLKDLIKIENRILTDEQANEVTIFAPLATINIIKEFEVVEKKKTHLPHHIKHIFSCPNPSCITQVEPIDSFFNIEEQGKQVKLICHYCEKSFDRNEARVKI